MLIIEETEKTPIINGDISKGTFSIKGKSLPENAREFYNPILDWLKDFYKSSSPTIQVDIDLEYFNTASSGVIFKILREIQKMASSRKVNIYWHYEEDDIEIEEVGLEFQSALGEIIELKERSYQPRNNEDNLDLF